MDTGERTTADSSGPAGVTPGATPAGVRRGRRKRLWLILAMIPVTMLAGFLYGRFDGPALPAADPPGWATALGYVLFAAGLVTELGAVIFAVAHPEGPAARQ